MIEMMWTEHRLPWRAIAMVVAVTAVIAAADLAWRLWRGSTRRLAMIAAPVALAWLAGVWVVASAVAP